MKNIIKISFAFCVTFLLAAACGKTDANRDYGFPYIYIPQATVTGLDNSYPIPVGPLGQNSTYCCRYDEKTGTLDIALGVIRSGYIANAQAFSVKLTTCPELTASKLDEYSSKSTSAIELPAEFYTLPEKIEVATGKNSGTCYIPVDVQKLSEESLYESGKYKLLVLGLQITDPSAYELAEENTQVVIVIDFNSSYWDDVAENLPESEIRNLFPIY